MSPSISQLALVRAAVAAVTRALASARQEGYTGRDLDAVANSLAPLVREAEQGRAPQALRQLATEVLPQAAQAAALVVQRLTPALEAAQLELAQAAAARSCAYLCCANLGGECGPAAGEGVGNRRCR